MNADRLLAHYEKISDAPDAIPRLRRFILNLAVRGKLVPQDPNDEPASELLKRIAAEKSRLTDVLSSRGRRSDGRERTEAFEFTLPRGWTLSTLGSVALKITDGAHQTPTYVGSGVPFVSVKDFSAGRLDLSNTRFITENEHSLLYKRCDPKRGDILIGRIGTLGRAVLVDTDDEFSLFVSVGLIRFSHENIAPRFLRTLLNSPLVEGEFDRIKIGGGTHTNKLNLGDLQTVALPIPPLAEQHLIAAKVDELMALCEQLEAARTKRETTRDRLTTASLTRLDTPDPDPAVFQNHAGFALDSLSPLTTRPDQIKALRQTILNLAVRGKLVEQDPNDEPASELLKRIAAARMLVPASGRKTKKPFGDSSLTEVAFPLPAGWKSAQLSELVRVLNGRAYKKAELLESGTPVLRVGNLFTSNHWYYSDLELEEDKHCDVGDLIYAWSASFGPFIWQGPRVIYHYHIWKLPLFSEANIDKRFLYFFLLQKTKEIKDAGHGISMAHMTKEKMEQLAVPFPPLAEQHRIVAKVDELMALCDRLEASLTKGDDTRRGLLDALLHEGAVTEDQSAVCQQISGNAVNR